MKKRFLCFFFLVFVLTGLMGCKTKKDELVERAIASFIENYASDYLSIEKETTITCNLDYQVVTAIKALEDDGYDVKLTDLCDKQLVREYYENLHYSSPGEAYKAMMITKAFDLNIEKVKQYFETLNSCDRYSYAIVLIALKNYHVNNNLKEIILNNIHVVNEEEFLDADYAGMALVALYDIDIDKSALIKLITDNITSDGITSWGTVNSCSTAASLMGLIASDGSKDVIDSLVHNLLQFEKDGAFVWASDGDIDLNFSTPQCFSALVAYKIYLAQHHCFALFR